MNIYKFLLTIFLSIFLISCDSSKDDNTWLVGTSADNPPYEHMSDAEIVGFDIDLMIAIGECLGKNIEFKNMEFHGLLAALSSQNVDMVIAGMSITPERLARVDFSIPYADSKIALLHRRDDGFKDPENLKGAMVGVQLGTIWALAAHDMSIKNKFKTKALSNNLMLVEELKSKYLDAVVMEESQVKKFAGKYPMLASLPVKEYRSSFAIAMPKNSPHKNNLDHTIKILKGNGTIEVLAKKWSLIGDDG